MKAAAAPFELEGAVALDPAALLLQLADFALDQLALERGRAVDKDDAVAVVGLVQHAARFQLKAVELEARCMLHETDHCDGIVFLDRTSPLKRELVKRKIRRLQKQGRWV